MISTLLKVIRFSNKCNNLVDHSNLEFAYKEEEKTLEDFKQTFQDKEKINQLLVKFEDLKNLESLEQMDNVLFFGVKIGIEIGKSYKNFEEF